MVSRRRAFTVAELIVGTLVLGVLVTVGTAGLRAVDARQRQNVAVSDLSTVRDSQMRFAAVYETFTDHPADLSGVPQPIVVQNDPATAYRQVAVVLSSSGALGLASRAPDGTCHFMRVPPLATPGPFTVTSVPVGAVCDPASALAADEWPLTPQTRKW